MFGFKKTLSYSELQQLFNQAKNGQITMADLQKRAADLNHTAKKSKDDASCLLASLILSKFLSNEAEPKVRRRLQTVNYHGSSARSFRRDYGSYMGSEPVGLDGENMMLWWLLMNDASTAPGIGDGDCETKPACNSSENRDYRDYSQPQDNGLQHDHHRGGGYYQTNDNDCQQTTQETVEDRGGYVDSPSDTNSYSSD